MRITVTPPASAVRQAEPELEAGRTYSLPELIDFAEAHNPETRISWERAKQRAAQIGIARAALFPAVAVAALAQQSRYRVLFGDAFFRQDVTAIQPTLSVYYTLLDFGARRAGIQSAQAGLLAADFAFNNTHRQIIFAVTAAYYRLNSALAAAGAAEATLANAQTVQSAAEARLQNGLATLPDVLEARAATAQASYELETVRGAERLAHGQLAEALGIQPTAAINVQNLNGMDVPALTESADVFIRRALAQRPDLLAQAMQVQAAEAAIRAARSQYFPKVTFRAALTNNTSAACSRPMLPFPLQVKRGSLNLAPRGLFSMAAHGITNSTALAVNAVRLNRK